MLGRGWRLDLLTPPTPATAGPPTPPWPPAGGRTTGGTGGGGGVGSERSRLRGRASLVEVASPPRLLTAIALTSLETLIVAVALKQRHVQGKKLPDPIHLYVIHDKVGLFSG